MSTQETWFESLTVYCERFRTKVTATIEIEGLPGMTRQAGGLIASVHTLGYCSHMDYCPAEVGDRLGSLKLLTAGCPLNETRSNKCRE